MFSVYKKELQSYFFSPLAYVITAIFMLIFSFTFINWLTNLVGTTFEFSFATIFYNYFFYFIFLIPALTMKSFAEERKAGTEVLLMSSPLNVFQIVIGKFLAIATVYLAMMAVTFIYPVIALINGNVVWSSLICGYIGFFAWGLVCISVGMLMSTFTESQIIAAILGEASMLLLYFVDTFASNSFISTIPVVSDFLTAISPQARFANFATGVFSLSDLVFYITFVIVVLCWTMISVEKRRWTRG